MTTLINVFGLAMGLGCFILAYALVEYLRASERSFPNADRIAVRTMDRPGTPERQASTLPMTAPPVAKYLRADFPELEAVARATGGPLLGSGREGYFATVGDRTMKVLPVFADAEFLDVFAFPFLLGDKD